MPQPQSSHTYDVTIDGVQYEVTSDRELTDAQAYRFAKQQASQPQAEYQPGELASHMTGQAPSTVLDTPAHEPDTYWGGFRKSIGDQIREARTGAIEAMQGPAHPQTARDIAPLLIPGGIEGAMSGARNLVGQLRMAAPEGTSVIKGMRGAVGRLFDPAAQTVEESVSPMGIARQKGPQQYGARSAVLEPGAVPSAGVRTAPSPRRILSSPVSGEPVLPVEHGPHPMQRPSAAPAPSSPAPILRKATPTPTLEQNLGGTLDELLARQPEPAGTLPPEPSITPAWREGAFYSSGRPGVTEARYSEIVPDVIPEPTGDPSFAPVGDETTFNAPRQPGAAPGPGAMSPDDVTHQALLDKLGGRSNLIEPPFVPRDPEPSMADIALSDAREHWGSKNVPGATEPEVRAGTPLMERDQPRDLSAEPATRIGKQYLDKMSPAQMIEWYNKIADTGPFKTEAARQIRARGVSLP